jgi:hypothetical protein
VIWHDAALVKELLSVQLKETGPGQFRLTHSANSHDDMAVTLAMAVVAQLESLGGSPAKRWLETLSPIHACGMPNPREAVTCSKCHEPLTPVQEEPPAAYVPEPLTSAQPWSPWSPIPNVPESAQTVAAMQLVRDHQNVGHFSQFFQHRS